MQEYILGYSTIVGIKIFIIPLETLSGSSFTISPTVINSYSNDVITLFHIWCKVKATSHNTIFRNTQFLPVQPEIRTETNTFKFYEIFSVTNILYIEMLTIPHHSIS